MNHKPAIHRYGTLLSLYLAQSIPMTFFSTVMPVIMRMEHYSLAAIGLLQLVKLPWLLKFLWAPMVDKTGGTIQNYKRWIFASELFYAMVIFATAFLDLHTGFKMIVALMLIAFTASATQDIATDAFAYLILRPKERSLGNSMQSAGSFLGTVTGSGILLIIYYYFGWKYLLIALAGFVLLALIPLYFYNPGYVKMSKPDTQIGFKDIIRFFKQPRIGKRVILLFFFYAGLIGILTMLKPWMVDLGYNTKEIGLLSGIYGPALGAVLAIVMGFFIKRYNKRLAMLVILSLGLLTGLYFWYISQHTVTYPELVIAVLSIWGVYGMASVFIYTIAMDRIRAGKAGTDFTIQIVITHLGSLIFAVLSGKIAHVYGYSGLFLIEVFISIILLFALPHLYEREYKVKSIKCKV